MGYKNQLIRAMDWLAKKDDTIFIGQSVKYSGNAIYNTLKTIPDQKKIEVPVIEELQMGISMIISKVKESKSLSTTIVLRPVGGDTISLRFR